MEAAILPNQSFYLSCSSLCPYILTAPRGCIFENSDVDKIDCHTFNPYVILIYPRLFNFKCMNMLEITRLIHGYTYYQATFLTLTHRCRKIQFSRLRCMEKQGIPAEEHILLQVGWMDTSAQSHLCITYATLLTCRYMDINYMSMGIYNTSRVCHTSNL